MSIRLIRNHNPLYIGIDMMDIELRGYIRPIVLKLLSKGKRKTGSELAEEIGKKMGSKPSYGSIYPVLKKLKDKDLVKIKEEGKEKRYSLSEKGESFVREFNAKKEEHTQSLLNVLKTFKTIFEDEEIELLIENIEEKSKTQGPLLPELPQIHHLLLTHKNVENEKEQIRNELKNTLSNLKEILER